MSQAVERTHREMAANRLMIHLLQKGRPAPYKETLVGVLADPDTKKVPTTLAPAAGKSAIGPLGRIVLFLEARIRRISHGEPAEETPVAALFGEGQASLDRQRF